MGAMSLISLYQLAFIGIMAPLSFAFPRMGHSVGYHVGRRVTQMVQPWLTPLFCGLMAFGGSVAYALLEGLPIPHFHDEFSYLLAGDTFASGRLTNPTPPFPEHFETFHVLQVPTYASKYPPGQGLLLALGQLLGHPAVGVWLGTGLACAAICWMLQGLVPLRWALLGGVLAASTLGFSSPWSQSYWGGSLGVAGGALLFGGVSRSGEDPRPSHGVAIALGLVTLAVTRPFEGLVFSLPLGLLMGAWVFKRIPGPPVRSVLATWLVTVATLVPFVAGLLTYNASVTGSMSRMPYAEHEAQYGAAPVFLWTPAREVPEYSNEVFRRFQLDWALPEYRHRRTLSGYLSKKPLETLLDLQQILPVALFLPLLIMVAYRGRSWDRMALLCLSMVVLSLMGATFPGSRKLAPAAGPAVLLAIQGLRRLRLWHPDGQPVGRSLARAFVLAAVVSILLSFFQGAAGAPAPMARSRAEILRTLESSPEKHLVFVRYSADHNPHEEWVYNRADLETAKVVWARDRADSENRRLVEHFSGRKVWLLEADHSPRRLQEYHPSGGP